MYQAQTNSDGEVRRDSDGKENIEEAITNMLEKVLKEENSGEDCAAKNDETNFSISGEEMPSFLQEDSSRKERKANTNKPLRSKYPSNLISEQPPRFNKKFNTVNANKQRLDMKEKQIEYGMTFFPQNFEYKPIFHSKLPYPHSYYPPIEKNPVKELEDFAQNVLSDADRIDIDSYNQLKGLFYKIITTQNGSRITQRVIKKTNKDILSLILNEIKDQVHEMIVDPYANYFMQKFFSALKQTDRLLFLTHVGTHIIQISKSKIGTYPVQAFIEQLVTTEEKLIVIEAVKNYVLNLCFDTQAVHVIEKIIMCIEEDLIGFIYELIMTNFIDLANNINGLCVVKKIIIHTTKDETAWKILNLILERIFQLVQNPYGNYVIQVALDTWPDYFIQPIILKLQTRFESLSMQKYSSNVVEKCLEKGGCDVVNLLIDELLVNEKIVDLMKNNFGNYVVQKVLKLALGSFKAKLIKAILNNIEKIGDRKLIMKWKSIVYSHINNEDIGTPNWNNNCVYNNDRRMTVQPRVYRFGCTDQVIPNSNCDSVSKRRETYHMGPSDLMQMQRDRLIYSNMINDYQEYNEQVFPQIDYQPFTENQGHVYNSSRNFGYK